MYIGQRQSCTCDAGLAQAPEGIRMLLKGILTCSRCAAHSFEFEKEGAPPKVEPRVESKQQGDKICAPICPPAGRPGLRRGVRGERGRHARREAPVLLLLL